MYVLCEVEVVSLNDTGINHLDESLCFQITLQKVKINLENSILTTQKFLVNDQIHKQFFSMCLFHFSTCFEQTRAHHQENQLYQYNIWYMSLCMWPFRLQVGKFLSDLHTKRSPTQSDIYQMLYWYIWFSWWWARGMSKHVENWNKHIGKNCASSWYFTKNHNKIHGQKKLKKQKLSKTGKTSFHCT